MDIYKSITYRISERTVSKDLHMKEAECLGVGS